MVALGVDGKEIDLLSGTSAILDSTIATLNGIRVVPKSPGSTVASVRFGNQTASVGVHVYETATTLEALNQGKKLIGIPLSMAGGEVQSWQLPPGTWMVTMLPEAG